MCSITLIIVFVLSVIYLFKRLYNKGVSFFPGCLRLVIHGLILLCTKNIFLLMKYLGIQSVKNGGVLAFQYGWNSVYVLTNPEDATTALTGCLEKMFVYKLIDPLFGDTLVSAQANHRRVAIYEHHHAILFRRFQMAAIPLQRREIWKRNRRILDLAFKKNILENYLKLFNTQASCLMDTLSQKVDAGYVDITDEITENVLETTCQTTMGVKADGEIFVNDKYVKAIHRVFEIVTLRVQKPWLIFDVIFNRSNLKEEMEGCLKIIHETSTKMVEIRKLEYWECLQKDERKDHGDMQSFLQVLIENSTTSEGSVFTDHQLRCLCDNMLLAGFDTTTYELLFTLVCIGSDDGVQERIYKEIMEVLGEETALSWEHLAKLVYLEAAIKEALRLYPIAPVVARDATSDIQLGKVKIPAGSSIVVHLWSINRHIDHWGPDAEEYNPGRWLNPDMLPEHPNSFGSFSFGRRNCIGKHYAMMLMKTTLVYILRKYRITANHKNMDFDLYIMLKAKSGHLMKLELR